MTTYLIVFGLLTVWVVIDGIRRGLRGTIVLWAIGTLALSVLVLPFYLAKRPLKANDVREGGFAWNVLKNFALFWTVFMVVISIVSLGGAGGTPTSSDAEAAGAAIGTALVVVILATAWFFPMVGAIVLGFFLRKSSVVERGPTGPLAQEQRAV